MVREKEMPENRQMIGEILEAMGCITAEDIDAALEEQKGSGQRLGDILIEKGVVSDIDVTRALAEQFDIEMVDIEGMDIQRDVVSLVPQELTREHNLIPIELNDGVLVVAMSDPLDLFALDNLRFMVNYPVESVLATKEAIKNVLTRFHGMSEEQVGDMLQQFTEDIDVVPDGSELNESSDEGEDAPVIRLVTMIIMEAVRTRASDIHIEPMSNRLRIRYRIDGVCYEVESPPQRLTGAIISRIKIMSGMDMSEKRRPQDGRIALGLSNKKIDLRVSSLPATHGESVVMRILDKDSLMLGLSDLGFHPDDYKIFRGLIKKPNGIILVTGPTGSGKTTTLYSALNELNRPDTKIITAEEPVEYNLSGINQCQVNRLAGMTFQRIVRAMLRQAPEIVLVGEIRDHETAEIAIQAALTGHLVFSTLHTNDSPSALTRLIDLKVPPFLVASSIQAIIAQRLLRAICEECKEPFEPEMSALKSAGLTEDQIKGRTFYRGKGCENCRDLGYKGRKGIYEILLMTSVMRELTFNGASTDQLRDQAVADGMNTLLMDGLRKVLDGATTTDEVLAVAKAVE
jgi:type IV-A pilus assembly ATPase PilB